MTQEVENFVRDKLKEDCSPEQISGYAKKWGLFSMERGLNENTNGLVRQYLKKGSSLINISNEQLSLIAEKLNNRPRKTLGYRAPIEVFFPYR